MFEVLRFFVRTEQTQCLSELSADSSEEPTCRPTLSGDLKYLSWFGDGMKPKFGSNLSSKLSSSAPQYNYLEEECSGI